MRPRHTFFLGALLILALPASAPADPASPPAICPASSSAEAPAPMQGRITVGEEFRLSFESPAVAEPHEARGARLVWSQELVDRGASYIAPHFKRFDLPAGSFLVVRSPDGSRRWEYRGRGKDAAVLGDDGFWGIHIAGERAIVELYAAGPLPAAAVTIDRYARGFPESFDPESIESICGADDSREAKCYQTSQPTAYNRARTVARLMINGTSACTGWLLGSAGHLMTNNHCIGTSTEAANTDYEFMAEGGTCATSCTSFGACPGTVVATSGTLIKTNSTLDYSLIKLPTNPTGTYGFLQFRGVGATINERMYIAGHPAAWGKRISLESDNANDQSGFCEVFGFSGNHVRYFCDTQGGSSGSPVLGNSDHAVIALHRLAGCPNSGVASQLLVQNIGTSLPPNSVAGPGTCVANSTTLCLNNNRFKVQVSINGTAGQVINYSQQGGFFWAFSSANAEVGVKVLDGQPVTGNWWVFHGSLTTLPYTVTVTDTLVGTVKTYNKAANTMCGGNDNFAFQGIVAPGGGGFAMAFPAEPAGSAGAEGEADGGDLEAACSPSSTAVCLLNRFRVQVKRGGVAQPAVALTGQTGVFWFFSSANPEVAVKVLDGTTVNGFFWVFFGSLTDQSYQVTVTDTASMAVKNYNSPAPFCGAFDTAAF